MEKKRILIVEDEVAIAGDLQDILELEGYKVVGIAFSFDQALTFMDTTKPDLVILDIELLGHGTGLDVARVINKKYHTPFIFLTSYNDKESVKNVIDLNPEGYLIKPFKETDIAPALALAFAKNNQKKKEIFPSITFINNKLNITLSPQEYKILTLLWKGNRNSEIATKLFISVNTVKTHINKLFNKLEVNSRLAACTKIMSLK